MCVSLDKKKKITNPTPIKIPPKNDTIMEIHTNKCAQHSKVSAYKNETNAARNALNNHLANICHAS